MIVLDVNVLSYLQSLKLLPRLKDVFRLVGGGHVPWEVYKQVKRSGALGDLLDRWIEEGLVVRHNFTLAGPGGRLVDEILRSKDARLVRKDVADVQCVALAKLLREGNNGVVLTCERGLPKLCSRRGVGCVDLFDVLSLMLCHDFFDSSTIESLLGPWSRADAGNGRPNDYTGSFAGTFDARYSDEGCDRVDRIFAIEIA